MHSLHSAQVKLWSSHVFSSSTECSARCRFSHEMLFYLQTDELKHDLILAEHYQGFIDALFLKEWPEVKALNQKRTKFSFLSKDSEWQVISEFSF